MSISYKFWNTESLEEYLKDLLVYLCNNMEVLLLKGHEQLVSTI